MPNGFIISKESWQRMSEEERKWITFDTMQDMHLQLRSLRRWNKIMSGAGGIVGGILAFFGLKVGA